LKYNPEERITLRNMLNHPFITQYFPNATSCLIRPDINAQYQVYVINKDHPLNQRNQIKKKFEGEKSQTIRNSRNYNNPNFINIHEYNNKEIYDLKSAANEKKDNKKYTYTTTNFDNNKIFLPPGKFLNNSQNSNYQFHEIKSTSRDKYSLNKINSANKSQNNNFYFELWILQLTQNLKE